MRHLAHLDGLRSLAAILIVFCHVYRWLFRPLVPATDLLARTGKNGYFILSLFVPLSGFVLEWSRGGRPILDSGKSWPFASFLLKRGLRLLPMAWLARALDLALIHMLTPESRVAQEGAFPMARCFLFLAWTNNTCPDKPAWFIAPLLVCSSAFPFMQLCVANALQSDRAVDAKLWLLMVAGFFASFGLVCLLWKVNGYNNAGTKSLYYSSPFLYLGDMMLGVTAAALVRRTAGRNIQDEAVALLEGHRKSERSDGERDAEMAPDGISTTLHAERRPLGLAQFTGWIADACCLLTVLFMAVSDDTWGLKDGLLVHGLAPLMAIWLWASTSAVLSGSYSGVTTPFLAHPVFAPLGFCSMHIYLFHKPVATLFVSGLGLKVDTSSIVLSFLITTFALSYFLANVVEPNMLKALEKLGVPV